MKALVAPFVFPISQPPIKDGALVLEEERIVAVGDAKELLAKYKDVKKDQIEKFPGSVLMPGLVNAHTHLDLLFFENKSLDFVDFLIAGWNFRSKQTLADRRQCLEEGIRQLLRAGVTSVGDVGHFVGLIPQAINSPIRMTLFPELLHGGAAFAEEGYEGAFTQIEEILASTTSRITAGIAPYAPYTLSRHLLKIIAQQARTMRIPLKIHVAETFAEMQFFYESSGEIAEKLFPAIGWKEKLPPSHRETPIQYLESIGFLENRPTLVGCNHLAEPDLQILSKTGAKVVHSPRSNAHLKLGRPPIRKLLGMKVPVAIGTDGTASLHSLSIWDEIRFIQDHYPEAERPKPTDLLKMATLHGAHALGLDDRIGSLEPGKEADVIAVKVPKEMTPSDLPGWLVANTTAREIAAVFVEGKRIK